MKIKERIFYLIWTGICSWIFTQLLIWIIVSNGLDETSVVVWTTNLIHGWGFAVRKVILFVLFVFFLISGVHKYFGKLLLFIIGISYILFIAAIFIFVGWKILTWIL